jgi:hypothetical protein
MICEKLKTWQSTLLLSFREELRDFLAMTAGSVDVPLADGYAGLRSLRLRRPFATAHYPTSRFNFRCWGAGEPRARRQCHLSG